METPQLPLTLPLDAKLPLGVTTPAEVSPSDKKTAANSSGPDSDSPPSPDTGPRSPGSDRSDDEEVADLVKNYRTSRLRASSVLDGLEKIAAARGVKLAQLITSRSFGDLLATAMGRGRASVQEVECCLVWLRSVPSTHIYQGMRAIPKVGDAYLHLARAYAHRGTLEKAEMLMVEMQQKGLPTGAVAAQLFDAAVRTGRFDRAWWMLERALTEQAKVDKVVVSLLLKRGQHSAARLRLVEQFIAQHRYEADEVLFNSLLAAYCRSEDMVALERTAQQMLSYGIPPSAATFGTLLKAYGARGDFGSVRKTWEGMKLAGIGINSVTYGCMLDASVRCKQFAMAEAVFQELRDVGMHKNTILYSTMIKAYAKRKDLVQAIALKQEMLREQVPLNCVTYNSLIDVAVRCREYKTALSMLDEMEAAGLHADLITYSTLIKGLTDLGMLSEAMQLFVQVEQSGFNVDEILMNSLLDGCVKAKAEPRVAMALIDRMRLHNIAPSQVTLAACMKVFAVHADPAGALQFLQTQTHHSEHVLGTLVKTLLAEGFATEAAEALQQLGPLPLALHTQVLAALTEAGEMQTALDLLGLLVALLSEGVPRRHGRDVATSLAPSLMALASGAEEAQVDMMMIAAHVDQLVYLRFCTQNVAEQVRCALFPPCLPIPSVHDAAGHSFAEFVPGQAWASASETGSKWWSTPLAELEVTGPMSPSASPRRRKASGMGIMDMENALSNISLAGKSPSQSPVAPERAPLGAVA